MSDHWAFWKVVMKALLSTSGRLLWAAALCLAIASGCRSTPIDSAQTSPSPAASPSPATPADTPTPAASAAAPIDTPTAAAPVSPTQAIDCSNPQSNQASDRCAQVDYETADAQLNEVYQQLKNSLTSAEQAQLTDAETAWITFRDSNCNFEKIRVAGQEAQSAAYYNCLEEMTKRRTAELQVQANPL